MTGRSISAACCLVALGLLCSSDVCAQPASAPVKLSRSGICHDASSPHHGKLKEFQSFGSMDTCIKAGGRLSQADARKAEARSSDSSTGLMVWSLVAIAVLGIAMIALLPKARDWYVRRKNRNVEAEFQEAEQRRWEGHRLDTQKDKEQ